MASTSSIMTHAPSSSSRSNTSNKYELHEIIELLGQQSDLQDIVLVPPDDGEITEEDSGDKAGADMNRLPPRVLRSNVEVNMNTTEDFIEVEGNPDTTVILGKTKPPAKRRKKEKSAYKWSSSIDNITNKKGMGDSDETTVHNPYETNVTPLKCFELMFTDEVIKLICDMSNEYALQRIHNLNVTTEEVKVYISILLLAGYMTLKYMRMRICVWEVKSDTHNDLVSQSMRRNRFFEIQQYLNLCDNLSVPINDRFGKVRSYFDMLNKNYKNNFEKCFSGHLSVDETMVPYYGRHCTKQHIHGKPIRFGYKLWSITTRNGYLISFEPYQGAQSRPMPLQDSHGLGGAVVLEMESRLPKQLEPYNLYFDNFFTGLQLLKSLSERRTGGTGTIRESRTEKCPIESKKVMKK